MKTTVVNYFEDETNERVATRFYVGNNEVSFEQYSKLINNLMPDENEDNDEVTNGNMEDMIMCDCEDCQEQRRLEAMEQEEECYCHECNKEREDDLITECLDMVFDPDACVECTIDKVIETLYKFKMLGAFEVKQDMREFLED